MSRSKALCSYVRLTSRPRLTKHCQQIVSAILSFPPMTQLNRDYRICNPSRQLSEEVHCLLATQRDGLRTAGGEGPGAQPQLLLARPNPELLHRFDDDHESRGISAKCLLKLSYNQSLFETAADAGVDCVNGCVSLRLRVQYCRGG